MCFLTYICNYLFLFHTLFYNKNGDWVFHLMEVLLYQACENGLTLGQALQVCCSVIQSFLSNCCQNCATQTWSLYNVMWIICYPMLLFSKAIFSHEICMSHSMSILSGKYIYPFFSTHLSKTNFTIASSIPSTCFIPIIFSIKPAKISMLSKRRLRNKNTLSGMIFSTCTWFLPYNGSAWPDVFIRSALSLKFCDSIKQFY